MHYHLGQSHIPAGPASAAAKVRRFVQERVQLTSYGYNIPVRVFKDPGVRGESVG
jgi:hypothetical protein